jgi:hypothetical protein
MREVLRVIPGEWVIAPDWLDLPASIRARAPDNRNRAIRVRVHREDVLKQAMNRRRQPGYDFWGCLNGRSPPVPHRIEDPDAGLTSLFDAHALFKGVRRPIAEDGAGDRFLAYVLKPRFHFVYDPRPPLMMTHKDLVAPDLVFVAYVRLDHPEDEGQFRGVLTHWHFVECDPRNAMLPLEYDKRYDNQLW